MTPPFTKKKGTLDLDFTNSFTNYFKLANPESTTIPASV